MALAENGNFLVRERVRNALKLLIPTECNFFPTQYKGTNELTPWYLAVSTHDLETEKMKRSVPHCDQCGFPLPPDQSHRLKWKAPTEPLPDWEADVDLFKSKHWTYRTFPWTRLCMSVRLFCLLKKMKAKGLHEATCQTSLSKSPTAEESRWIESKLIQLNEHGIQLNAPGTLTDADAKWYRKFLKNHTAAKTTSPDFKSFEKQAKLKLPKSYKDFLAKVGPCSFPGVDEQDGFTAHVVAPQDFDCTNYRAGTLQAADDESNGVDGVMFARTDHGDCFCFDVRKDRKEFEVFLYLHEYNCFEPYAANFAACIKRFVAATSS